MKFIYLVIWFFVRLNSVSKKMLYHLRVKMLRTKFVSRISLRRTLPVLSLALLQRRSKFSRSRNWTLLEHPLDQSFNRLPSTQRTTRRILEYRKNISRVKRSWVAVVVWRSSRQSSVSDSIIAGCQPFVDHSRLSARVHSGWPSA